MQVYVPTDLHFFSVLTNDFHQSWEEVRHGVCRNRLMKGSEQLEGAAGVVAGRTAQGRLQSHLTELLLQMEI